MTTRTGWRKGAWDTGEYSDGYDHPSGAWVRQMGHGNGWFWGGDSNATCGRGVATKAEAMRLALKAAAERAKAKARKPDAPTSHIALAYWAVTLQARVVPCAYRLGVWAVVKADLHKPATWQVVHAPSGATVRNGGTKREAVQACKRLGEACGMWAFDCGFGDAPELPAKVARLAGAKPVERVG